MNHNPQQSDRLAYTVIGSVSAVVLAFLFWLIYFKEAATSSHELTTDLPLFNAFLNSLTTILLIAGYVFIKRGLRRAHIATMLTATGTSAVFLVSYIIYHHFQGDTPFVGQGLIRPVYFFILISHIILSMVMVPLVFATLYQAARRRYVKHKALAKITLPIWLYVSVTGVLIFIFLNWFNY